MSDTTYFTDAWQPKEVLDPETETNANESIIQMVFYHKLACIYHIIMSNYTWKQADIQTLISFYETLGEEINPKVQKVQQNSEANSFSEKAKKFGLLDLPIYSKCVDSSQLIAESASRVYHDAKEYMNNGSATEAELYRFVSSILKEVLEPIFNPKEIRNVLKGLITSLVDSRSRDEEIGSDIEKNVKYEVVRFLPESPPNFPGFNDNVSRSITNFIGYFALHTIRHHCYVNFGVDGELKFYQRNMYKKAFDDLRVNKAKPTVSVKPEASLKREPKAETPTLTRVKPEIRNDSDEDFCEIIEPVNFSAVKKSKTRQTSESNAKGGKELKDFPEKYMLEDLDKDDLPMNFKTKFRKLVEQNQMLRDEINDYKELIQLKIAEKKQRMG
ncbi:uncharacterized protein CELE_T16H12.3 [Caenorhabditis elegans]|uniref:Uncharacterized protein T16H12.3 n=1 Tax=Caenorhabditis elegans TaxID=6239 RepID=YNV3_CAEEL|nr:Uncharacterized protein CELE_T16H12.3 [Caenorhabditis elegans]P34566.3 RecName: Full=Uncharacterized protein T16H12.3 [Caenorhabditis elegans]CAA83136.3 Uncharacterized protein CELE_T16H12.3 [Caenorhabditis elegans]|eukprot:NP_001022762.2 Uncharacterized protein CELE_T16H12.3 [Caenorhabditis elegans]